MTRARASQGVMWPVFSFCFCGVFCLTIPALLWNGFHICQMETIHLVELPFLESGDPPGDGNGPGLKGLRSPSSHSITAYWVLPCRAVSGTGPQLRWETVVEMCEDDSLKMWLRDPVGWASGSLGELSIKVTFERTQAGGLGLAAGCRKKASF